MATFPRWVRFALLLLVAHGTMGASCGQDAVAVLPGVINDSANRSLRRAIFAFAIEQLCEEMLGRSVPLKLRDEDPSVGRFFPTTCNVTELGNEKNLFVQLTGHGYGWSNVTGRLGFEASASVEYEHDFLVQDGRMYVYFRQRHTQSSAFKATFVETRQGPAASAMSMVGGDVAAMSQQVGERVLAHQVARGFTVVRQSDGSTSFTLGVLEKGEMPFAPFGRGDSTWPLLANDRVELRPGQVDFAGPFEVEDGEALWLTTVLEGAPSLGMFVVPKAAADAWILGYEKGPNPGPPPGPVLHQEELRSVGGGAPIGMGGPAVTPHRRALPLPPGTYYVVLDHSALLGHAPPQPGASPALVSYAVQRGDAP